MPYFMDSIRSRMRHGPKLGSHEAEASASLEAESLTLVNLEPKAEPQALVTKLKPKPKPGYLYSVIFLKLKPLKITKSNMLIKPL